MTAAGATTRFVGAERVTDVEVTAAQIKDHPQDGETQAEPSADDGFDDFFRQNYPAVVGLIAALCQRRQLAEELAQDAFLKAYQRWERLESYDNPGAWVRRVAMNLAVSSFRRRRREALALGRFWRQRNDRAEQFGRSDDAFWAAVRALPPRQAQCVALRYVEDRTSEGIGVVLGICPATVRAHLHQAKRTLADQLGEHEEEDR